MPSGQELQTFEEAELAVGKRVHVHWPHQDPPTWFKGVLDKVENRRRSGVYVHVSYDDGDKQWHELAKESVRMESRKRARAPAAFSSRDAKDCMLCMEELPRDPAQAWFCSAGCKRYVCCTVCWDVWQAQKLKDGGEPACMNCQHVYPLARELP